MNSQVKNIYLEVLKHKQTIYSYYKIRNRVVIHMAQSSYLGNDYTLEPL